MKTEPLFSIITVCYNSQKTIERTIKSVLHQDFKDYEYIIIDGSSTDGTVEIIKKYEPLFCGRMRWISEPDNGIYDAFNKGIRCSKGKLTWLVNSDDYIEKNALSVISNAYSLYSTDNYPIISFAANFIKDGKFVKKLYSSENGRIRAFKHNYQGIVHPATIIPKYVYNKVGMYDERFKIAGDKDFFHRAYKQGVYIEDVDKIITNMTFGGVSTNSHNDIMKKDQLLFFKNKYNSYVLSYLHFFYWLLKNAYK